MRRPLPTLALVLAGCAAASPPLPAPGSPPRPSPPPAAVPVTEEEPHPSWLIYGEPSQVLRAARDLPPEDLTVEEMRIQAGIVADRAAEIFHWAGNADGDWTCEGLRAVGSPEVLRLLAAAARASARGVDLPPADSLHRVLLADHLPGLADLLEEARGETYRWILLQIRSLADGSDAHHRVVQRALLYARRAGLAEAEGRPLPRWAEVVVHPAGPGLPEAFLEIAGSDLPLPTAWMDRWMRTFRPAPADLPRLDGVAWIVDADGDHRWARAFGAVLASRTEGPEAAALLRRLEAEGWPVAAWLEERREPDLPDAFTPAEAAAWLAGPDALRFATWDHDHHLLLAEAAAPEALDARILDPPPGADPERIASLRGKRGLSDGPPDEDAPPVRAPGEEEPPVVRLALRARAGDRAAREGFLAFLRDDRIHVAEDHLHVEDLTLEGDPAAMEHWRSRIGSSCCLHGRAARACGAAYPTLFAGRTFARGSGDAAARVREWWTRWGPRLRPSRIAGGLVPAAE